MVQNGNAYGVQHHGSFGSVGFLGTRIHSVSEGILIMAMCANCAEEATEIGAIVYNIPVDVCSYDCLVHLHNVAWAEDTLTLKVCRVLRRLSDRLRHATH